MMPFDLAFSLVAAVVLMLLVALSRWLWRGGKAVPAATKLPRAQRAPKPLAGLIQKPDCPVLSVFTPPWLLTVWLVNSLLQKEDEV